jgi:preprotein translocase subunit Sec61beta
MSGTIDGVSEGGVLEGHAAAPAVVIVLHGGRLWVAGAKVLAFLDGVKLAKVDFDPVAIVVAGLRVACKAAAARTRSRE